MEVEGLSSSLDLSLFSIGGLILSLFSLAEDWSNELSFFLFLYTCKEIYTIQKKTFTRVLQEPGFGVNSALLT